ncbi:MAG: AAA family ATPase [Halarcobacter sp.]
MSIDKNDIEKYIFDPSNPKQCKSYNLLLNISKNEHMTYISSGFTNVFYENTIINKNFNDKLWDKPSNFDKLDINQKISLFRKALSEKEYIEHINSLDIKVENFIYNKIFNSFFDVHPSNYITKMTNYDKYTIKSKIIGTRDYSFAGYKEFKDTYSFCSNYQGHKIIFTNDSRILNNSDYFFDISSIVITTNQGLFFDFTKTALTGKIILNKNINQNLKPIFLKDINDVILLLKVLQEDLKKEKQKNIEKEEITNLKNIEINDFFSIKNLRLENLEDKKEIYLVGENGDGKSLFLQALTLGLKGISEGDVFDTVKSQKDYVLKIEDTNDNIYDSQSQEYKNLFAYGANRNNNCQMKEDETGYLTLFNASIDLKNPIDWLIYLDHSEKSGKKNIISVDSAKKHLQELLNSDIKIDISPDKVIFTEKGSIVGFNQLSAGYKGVITILTDLLARLSDNQPYVKKISDFKGIVLIDEIELHLHPKWKYDLVKKLRNVFPLIQFIMTTHSPTVILGASPEAVFYKIYKEDGEVKISNQIPNEGYTNNTLVSSPLFDLETVTSRNYDSNEKSLSNDDYVYEKIHDVISKKIKNESTEEKEEISKLIDEELEKL